MIQTVHKSVQLLEVLAQHYPQGVSLQELSFCTGISKSTCVHILNTLIEDKFVERKRYAQYCLGIGCFYLTRSGKFDKERLDICRPVLRWLKNETGETTLISEIRNSEKYTVDYVIGEYALKNSGMSILMDHIYRTATGRMILSHLPQEELQDILIHHGMPKEPEWQEFKNPVMLQEALQDIRKRPWITVQNKCESGYCIGYAAPLFDGSKLWAALGITICRKEPVLAGSDFERRLSGLLMHAAKEMNRRLEFR